MLHIPPKLIAAMIDAGRSALPFEAAGILLGDRKGDGIERADSFVRIGNTACGAGEFTMDEREFAAALRGNESRLIAFFHTHPTDIPAPSARDLSNVGSWTGVGHLILSFYYSEPKFSLWRMFDGQAIPEEWKESD